MGSCIRRDTYHIARGSVEFPKADNPANVTVVTEKARYERQDSALTSWTFVLTQIKASLSRPSDEGRQQAWCGLMMVTCLCASRSDIRYYACAPTPKRKNCNHLIQTYPYDSMSAMSRQRVREKVAYMRYCTTGRGMLVYTGSLATDRQHLNARIHCIKKQVDLQKPL